jgi:hypothetical protein
MGRFQKIIRRKTRREPSKSSWRGRLFTWRAGTEVTTVTLACGHKKTYRGMYVPEEQALCKECVDG